MITAEHYASKDLDAVLAEKRDKLNARLQIWSLLLALISGFGIASVQQGNVSYVVVLYPLLAACLAQFAGHSESVLDQIKAYLLQVEARSEYQGYETYNKTNKLKTASSGGHKRALLTALLITELLATTVVVSRLIEVQLPLVAGIVLIIESIAVIATVRFLRETKWTKQRK